MAEIDLAGSIDLELRALDWLYNAWLPTSGYAPAHQPMFEAFNGLPDNLTGSCVLGFAACV